MPSGSVGLLDINVLIALFDPDHVHHELAHDWLADHRAQGWASCPVTENGFVRVVSNPAYGLSGFRAEAALKRLKAFMGAGRHTFWPDAVSLSDERLFDLSLIGGSRQLTDVYLLGLAVRQEGRLITFDRTIPRKAVKGATMDALQVIGPADRERE